MSYLFHHIPKSAGTTCLDVFSSIFNLILDYHESTKVEDIDNYLKRPINLGELDKNDMICGHYNLKGMYLYERYPNLDFFDIKKICIFRDPLDTAMSGVRFGILRGWLEIGNADVALITRAGYISSMLQCTNESYKKVIDSYWFVGISDDLDMCLRYIADRVGKKITRKVKRLNTSVNTKVEFSINAIDEFRKLSELDFRIYEYVRTKCLSSIS